jgi:hypothetical protein
VHLHVQFIHRHPILEVAVEPVGLLDQHHANGRMRLEVGDHLAEGGAPSLLGRFHVHILLHDRKPVRCGIFFEELQLRRDREALLFLLFRGDAGIDHRLAPGGFGGGCGLRCFLHAV